MPTQLEAVRCLAGGADFDFAEGYPSAFVVQLLRMLAEFPAELQPAELVPAELLPAELLPAEPRAGDGAWPAIEALPAPEPPLGPWIASRTADDVVLGAVSCATVEDGTEGAQSVSAVTVGYDVAPACEGRGYATEMLRLVCAHLLARPGITRVWADTEADHGASRRVMEKAGLTWRRDETVMHEGRQTTVVHYARDRVPGRP